MAFNIFIFTYFETNSDDDDVDDDDNHDDEGIDDDDDDVNSDFTVKNRELKVFVITDIIELG